MGGGGEARGTRRERKKKGGSLCVCVCVLGGRSGETRVYYKIFLHQFAEKKLLPFLLNSIF